ncbi:hypothetical protein Tco_1011515, partial [Tanacetum coccineum]
TYPKTLVATRGKSENQVESSRLFALLLDDMTAYSCAIFTAKLTEVSSVAAIVFRGQGTFEITHMHIDMAEKWVGHVDRVPCNVMIGLQVVSIIRISLCTVKRAALDLTYCCSKMRFMGISDNHWPDKKLAAVNWIEGRGKFKVNAGFHLGAVGSTSQLLYIERCMQSDGVEIQHSRVEETGVDGFGLIMSLQNGSIPTVDPYKEAARQALEQASPPLSPIYVLELVHLAYLAPPDNGILIEYQPLPADASPMALLPGCIAEANPEEDPDEDPEEDPEEDPADYPTDGGYEEEEEEESFGDDADDEDEEEASEEENDEEEEEHLAPANSSAIPIDDPVPSAKEKEPFETDESAPTHRHLDLAGLGYLSDPRHLWQHLLRHLLPQLLLHYLHHHHHPHHLHHIHYHFLRYHHH